MVWPPYSFIRGGGLRRISSGGQIEEIEFLYNHLFYFTYFFNPCFAQILVLGIAFLPYRNASPIRSLNKLEAKFSELRAGTLARSRSTQTNFAECNFCDLQSKSRIEFESLFRINYLTNDFGGLRISLIHSKPICCKSLLSLSLILYVFL